jgi:GNAT superfamily N-acetyltransferase
MEEPPPGQYRYRLSRDMTVAAAAREYAALTFPSIARQAEARHIRDPLIAVAAERQGSLVAMVLAEWRPDGPAQVISLFVQPEHRRRGLAAGMLARLERALAQGGVTAAELVFHDDWPAAPVLRHLLNKAGWLDPQARLLLCRTTTDRIAQAPWLRLRPLPAGFDVFPWLELRSAERAAILASQAARPWYPEVLSPFQEEARIEALNSLGLRYHGQVVGWMVTHRTAPDTIQYTSMFVRPPYQGLGRGIALAAQAIRLQVASDIPRGLFQVETGNQAMASFVQRRMRPYLTSVGTAWVTRKRLRR